MSLSFAEMELAHEISSWLKSIADDIDLIESKTMTLRDQFASMAIIRIRNDFPTKGIDEHSMARHCYKIADAMMEARKLKPEKAKD